MSLSFKDTFYPKLKDRYRGCGEQCAKAASKDDRGLNCKLWPLWLILPNIPVSKAQTSTQYGGDSFSKTVVREQHPGAQFHTPNKRYNRSCVWDWQCSPNRCRCLELPFAIACLSPTIKTFPASSLARFPNISAFAFYILWCLLPWGYEYALMLFGILINWPKFFNTA